MDGAGEYLEDVRDGGGGGAPGVVRLIQLAVRVDIVVGDVQSSGVYKER